LDGEVTALGGSGISSFSAIQSALSKKQTTSLFYFAFDLLYLDGYDLREIPLSDRKKLLAALLQTVSLQQLQYVDHVVGHGPEFFAECCKSGLEGAISKRVKDPYRGGRTHSWLKVKCGRADEFVVGGFTTPSGKRSGFGSLLLGE